MTLSPIPDHQPQTDTNAHSPEENRGELLMRRMDELSASLREKLIAAEVPLAATLTPDDIVLAALNGISSEMGYFVPPLRPSLTEYVCELRETALVQHVDLLQNCARKFHDLAAHFEEELIELVAFRTAQGVLCNRPVSVASRPSLDITGCDQNKITILVPSHNYTIHQHLSRGATVFIPGAGYNSAANLHIMGQRSDVEFVLNDRDPFLAAILQKTLSILNLSNVRFIAGEMTAAAQSLDQIDLVLLGDLYTSTPEEAHALIKAILGRAPLGAPIHLVHINSEGDGIKSSGQDWIRVMREEGINIMSSAGAFGHLSPAPYIPRRELLALSGQEIMKRGLFCKEPRENENHKPPFMNYAYCQTGSSKR